MDFGYYVLIVGIVISFLTCIPITIGFGRSGISANSTAASMQSEIGYVREGSGFSKMTSFGMKGYFIIGCLIGIGIILIGSLILYFT